MAARPIRSGTVGGRRHAAPRGFGGWLEDSFDGVSKESAPCVLDSTVERAGRLVAGLDDHHDPARLMAAADPMVVPPPGDARRARRSAEPPATIPSGPGADRCSGRRHRESACEVDVVDPARVGTISKDRSTRRSTGPIGQSRRRDCPIGRPGLRLGPRSFCLPKGTGADQGEIPGDPRMPPDRKVPEGRVWPSGPRHDRDRRSRARARSSSARP